MSSIDKGELPNKFDMKGEEEMAESQTDAQYWIRIAARSLAFIALEGSGLRAKTLTTQGEFLKCLGFNKNDAAELLGTSARSLTELKRQQSLKKRGKNATKK